MLELDAAGVRVSDAIRPVRLRADGRVSPVLGGRVAAQHATNLLLIATGAEPVPSLPPTLVVIDGVGAEDAFRARAAAWASACGAAVLSIQEVGQTGGMDVQRTFRCGWRFMSTFDGSEDPVQAFAVHRGEAAAHLVGAAPELAAAASLIAGASRCGEFPPQLREAATLLRRLAELAVPIDLYDAACSRWHTPTLTQRLEDLDAVRSSSFPSGWRMWAETSWAGVKDGVLSAARADTAQAKRRRLLEIVDTEIVAGRPLDVAAPSRTARDALLRYLGEAGVPLPTDGSISLRSIRDLELWGPPRASLLLSPPSWSVRLRLVAADVGALNVLAYEHELHQLRRSLSGALREPDNDWQALRAFLPAHLSVSDDPERSIDVTVHTVSPRQPQQRNPRSFVGALEAIEIAALEALETTTDDVADLPDDENPDPLDDTGSSRADADSLVSARPVLVSALEGAGTFLVHLPTDGCVVRVVGDTSSRLPVHALAQGMVIVGLDGVSPFERLRPLLLEARGPVVRLLLAAWEQALGMALTRVGGARALCDKLTQEGAQISMAAVAQWTADERIGPQDPANVRKVGTVAEHPVVRDQADTIADVMKGLRTLHRLVGATIARRPMDVATLEQIDQLLGPDGVSLVQQIVTYRVLEVRSPRMVSSAELYRPESLVLDPEVSVIPSE